MRAVLIDCDAFVCLRGLGLVGPVVEALARVRPVAITEYVARHELSDLQAVVSGFEHEGKLCVHPVTKGAPAFATWRELRSDGHDKGEAELIAWALHAPETPLFVTRDGPATRLAIARRVPVTDVLGIVVEACETGGLDVGGARSALAIWDDKGQQRCRPHPYPGFDAGYAERLKLREAWA